MIYFRPRPFAKIKWCKNYRVYFVYTISAIFYITSNQLLFYLKIRTRRSLYLRSGTFTIANSQYLAYLQAMNIPMNITPVTGYTPRGFILSYYSCHAVSLHRRPRDLLIPILGTTRYSVHFNSCNYRFWMYVAQVPTYTRIIPKLLRYIDNNTAAFAYSNSYRRFHTQGFTRWLAMKLYITAVPHVSDCTHIFQYGNILISINIHIFARNIMKQSRLISLMITFRLI